LYTTQLQAGQGLVDETRALLTIWQPGMTVQNLHQAALSSGRFPGVTARRLRNIVAECFAPRYLVDDATPAKTLKIIQDSLSHSELEILLLVFTSRANQILGDFLREVYWRRYAGGYQEIDREDAERFVRHALNEGKMIKRWSESTIRRVSAYLLGCCGDYGLLSRASSGKRRLLPLHITPLITAYVAYELHLRGASNSSLPECKEWSWLGLDSDEVLARLKEVAVRGWIIVQSVAGLTDISWKFKSMEELCDAVSRR
jgi:hypothetical protein